MAHIIKRKELVLVRVIYYRRDYTHLLQDFSWQTEDYVPDIPRVHAFLVYWKDHIGATIKEIEISSGTTSEYRHSNFYKVMQ